MTNLQQDSNNCFNEPMRNTISFMNLKIIEKKNQKHYAGRKLQKCDKLRVYPSIFPSKCLVSKTKTSLSSLKNCSLNHKSEII